MNKTTYITTAIPYVNAHPHIGFALELVQADVLARYSRLAGNRTRLQTGTDENAFKNVLSAKEKGLPTRQFVDEQSEVFQDLCRALNISQDQFIRTTSPCHRDAVYKFWRKLQKGDIYLKQYRGLYCAGCEDFFIERDLVDGLCPDHGIKPVRIEEENYFFRLSRYQAALEALIASDKLRIIPEARKNEVLGFIRRGLHDISISRPAERSEGWGIPVPDDASHVIYVWIDALINYISGLGFGTGESWSEYWNDENFKLHVIGKNVWKFHAVYWPALLLSAGLPLPDAIFVHGFVTINGEKISKSRGITVDPFDCIAAFGNDGIRHYLLRYCSPVNDSDFAADRLKLAYNTDLANGIGNLVSRLFALCQKVNYGRYFRLDKPPAPDGFHDALDAYCFNQALAILWNIVRQINQDIEIKRPWDTLKSGDNAALRTQLKIWLDELWKIAYWLEPFLPDTSAKIIAALSQDNIVPIKVLFPRIK